MPSRYCVDASKSLQLQCSRTIEPLERNFKQILSSVNSWPVLPITYVCVCFCLSLGSCYGSIENILGKWISLLSTAGKSNRKEFKHFPIPTHYSNM